MAVLTDLGLDTGYDVDEVDLCMSRGDSALEWLRGKATRRTSPPTIIKHPLSTGDFETIVERAERSDWPIGHVFLTLRDLDAMASSHASKEWGKKGVPKQYEERRKAFYYCRLPTVVGLLLLSCLRHEFTLMLFPKLVEDPDYCYRCLTPVLPDIGYAEFLSAWKHRVDKSRVHFR